MQLESEAVWGYGYLILVCPEMFWIFLSHLLINVETAMYLKNIFRLAGGLYTVEVSSMIIPCVFYLS